MIIALCLLLITTGGTLLWADNQLQRTDAITSWSGEPAAGHGTNWLLAGTDSREGLTSEQKQQYHTGSASSAEGSRADSIMILHEGDDGPALMSIPRDSWVTIPAYTDSDGTTHPENQNKINTARTEGGPQLLLQTVELNTNIHIDHYMEVGFAGLVNVVNALGGVDMCLSEPVQDEKSGADLNAGCQTLNGEQSLAFVRTRYSLPDSDLSRIQDQQQFINAMTSEMTSWSTVLNPFNLYPLLSAGLNSVTVDDNTSMFSIFKMAKNLLKAGDSSGTVLTVPISNQDYETNAGSAVLWDSDASQTLFGEIQNDQPITVTSSDGG
ncbi:LCP family protein [Streptomyces fractus]|uniref:LCP family protein n=1 Tax=Streptomyces fractus TaxID=641806 RepID=UPI003CF214FA